MKIFGRDPTLWLAFLTGLISLAGTLGFRLLGEDQAAIWNLAILAVAGALTAYAVRPIQPAAFTYAVGALVQLGAAYGLNVTDPQLSMLNALVIPTLALLTRGQVSPVTSAISKITDAPTPEAAKAEYGSAAGLPDEGTAPA